MRFLLIGSADSFLIKKYLEKIVIPQRYDEIAIISRSNFRYKEFYEEKSIKVYAVYPLMHTKIVGYLQLIYNAIFHGRYDIIHIHYVKLYALLLSHLIGKKIVVASFWGSDLLRVSSLYKKILFYNLKHIDYITFETCYMESRFRNISPLKCNYNIRRIFFGVSELDSIKKLMDSSINRSKAKEEMKFPINKKVIAIGYNDKQCQQHDKVLDIINEMEIEITSKIHLVLQLSYGDKDENYIGYLISKLNSLDCSYTIINSFLNEKDNAILRLSTDIFIHAQTTDSFSSSVMEYLYSGTLVFNPVWIDYEELDKKMVIYKKYSDWEDLFVKLKSVLVKNQLLSETVRQSNKKKISEMMSWDMVKNEWEKLYE